MKRSSGITLIELLATIAIIGILTSLLIFGMSLARGKAQLAKAHAEVAQLSQAWKAYWTVYGKWPAMCEGATNMPMGVSVMKVLMGNDAAQNPQNLKFMEPNAYVLTDGYIDPWGKLYVVNFSRTKSTSGFDAYETIVIFPNRKRYDYDTKP